MSTQQQQQQQQQQQLYELLAAALSATTELRVSAEQRLKELLAAPAGLLPVLLPLLAARAGQQDPAAHLGSILLRQYVQRRWERKDGLPALPDAEKAAARAALLPLMDVEPLVAAVVAEVAAADLPDRWPELPEHVVRTGNLRALETIAEHVSDEQLPVLLPAVLPLVARAAAAGDPQAFRCFSALLATLNGFGSVRLRRRAVQQHFAPALAGVLGAAGAACADPASPVALQLEAVRAAEASFSHLPREFVRCAGAVVPQVYRMLVGTWPAFRDGALLAPAERREYDAAGGEVSLSAVAADALDLTARLLDAGLGEQLVRGALGPLAAAAVLYAQLAEEQSREGREDPNEFAAFEDDENQNVSPRMAGSRLMHAMLASLGADAAEHLGARAAERLSAGEWRDHEVALFVAGHIAAASLAPASLPFGALAAGAVCPALADPARGDPLVVARAAWLVPRVARAAPPETAREAFAGLARAAAPGCPLPGRIAAVQAAGRAAMEGSGGDDDGDGRPSPLLPVLRPVLQGAAELLSHATDETLHTVLENFVELLEVDEDTTVAACGDATDLMLRCWSANAGDPYVAANVARAVQVMAAVPACLTPLQERLAPVLSGMLGAPAGAVPDAVLDVALMALHALLEGCRRAGAAPHPDLAARALPAAAATLARTDDDDVMDEASRVMCAFLRLTPAAVPGPAAVAAASRLLDPATPGRGAVRAGDLAWCVARAAGGLPPGLARAAVARMRGTDHRPQAVGLLVFFARLLGGEGCAAAQEELRREGVVGDLALAVHDLVPDVHGEYRTKVVFAFAMRLLEVRGPLADAPVPGPPQVDVTAGRSSRSRGGLATRPGPAEPLSVCLLRALARVWANLDADRRDGPDVDDAFLRGVVAGMTGGSGAGGFGGGDEDDDDDDEEEDDGGGFELLSDRLGGGAGGLFVGDEQDDEDDERAGDPLKDVDLLEAAAAFVRGRAQALAADASRLEGVDQETLNKMLRGG